MAKAKPNQSADVRVAAPAAASALPAAQPALPELPEPDEDERTAIARAATRMLDRRRRFSVKIKSEGRKLDLSYPHSQADGGAARMLDTFGTSSSAFANDAFSWLAAAVRDGGKEMPTEQAVNSALALIDGIAPENEVEALLAVQMAATHGLAMNMLSRARQTDYVEHTAVYGSLSVKLLRSFTAQVEALERLRRGGEQTLRVEHVHVHAGGQAVVGNVAAGGGAPPKIEDQPHAKHDAALSHADAPFDPLGRAHAERDAVPVSRHA